MDLQLSGKGWTAFTLIFGFIFVFIWLITIIEMSLLNKIIYTIGGAVATFFIVQAKNI